MERRNSEVDIYGEIDMRVSLLWREEYERLPYMKA